jgi:hypothetical protein
MQKPPSYRRVKFEREHGDVKVAQVIADGMSIRS